MSLISKRKSLEQITKEANSHGLRRCLGPWRLTTIGVGATVGAGIFVMTGTAAANFAGPAVVLSFIIAAIACLFTALSYGELSSTIPVAGSAYSYAYTSLGEKFAWAVGWLLLLEYGISAVSVASGFSSYSASLLQDFHINLPSFIHHPMFQPSPEGYGKGIMVTKSIDLVGAISVIIASIALLFGVSESTTINGIIVTLKVGILILFIAIGIFYINPVNLTPFIPESTGTMNFGTTGIFRAASTIFFAYIGFEAVSTAASEARKPQTDIPFGIIASLVISTLIYIGVAFVLVGVVPYKQLNVSDPLAIATNYINIPFLTWTLKISAVIGLCSVMLVLLYGQTRIFFIMAKDGLLPPAFCKLHSRYKTPWLGTLILGICVSVATAFLPIDIISDLVSLGTATAFSIVCLTVIWQRNAHPDLPRPFKVPFGGFKIKGVWIGYIPLLGIMCCLTMIVPLLIDMVASIFHHNPIPMILLVSYALVGFFGYYSYGRKHSVLGKQIQSSDET
ncbi:APC family permease [Commensalibacter communis]|uniref:Amino acid:H+ symporter family (PotE) n=1 Tax=Commensalibacter communis TaxID=2972786 RepID=A0A9W4TQ32_9PROT|nr:amino acid permease [Commensalibacter communis]CAI3950496.1 Serine transporter YbeC [Commensalibacter communis]CAI3951563.1 Serine transporter YbeC [Commensalibacter communis]CAI3955993.1 Serine transporter YbeC [Commensalibacter communis]CAI3957385.1 Serine transporter YbeC [Commensalibacter communis]CAI3957890.1 Serine transporter YbeC [Commensalibacter communis]